MIDIVHFIVKMKNSERGLRHFFVRQMGETKLLS